MVANNRGDLGHIFEFSGEKMWLLLSRAKLAVIMKNKDGVEYFIQRSYKIPRDEKITLN